MDNTLDWIAKNPFMFIVVVYSTTFAFMLLFDLLMYPILNLIFKIYDKMRNTE